MLLALINIDLQAGEIAPVTAILDLTDVLNPFFTLSQSFTYIVH